MKTATWIPLFPLNTVLFPLGILPLRVFETRYVDMVRDCLKHGSPFGVVLINKGTEVGEAAQPEQIGCLAHIRHWDMQDFGVLQLQTQGGARFRILATRETPDHRLEAQIEMLAQDKPTRTSALHEDITETLQKVIDEVQEQGETEQGDAFLYPFPLPTQLDDAGWVAHRWTEILPLALRAKQRLLAIDDPLLRLQAVEEHLTKMGVIGELNVPLQSAQPSARVLH